MEYPKEYAFYCGTEPDGGPPFALHVFCVVVGDLAGTVLRLPQFPSQRGRTAPSLERALRARRIAIARTPSGSPRARALMAENPMVGRVYKLFYRAGRWHCAHPGA